MEKLKIAFDVDDTLIIPSVVTGNRDVPNYETIAVFRYFQQLGCDMIIWSGSGLDWAKTWCEKLGLQARIIRKGSELVDIAFDDCDVELAKVNVKVQRVANNISRAVWNKTKKPYVIGVDTGKEGAEVSVFNVVENSVTKANPNAISLNTDAIQQAIKLLRKERY